MNDRSSSDQQVAPDPLLSRADPSLEALREEVVSAARELVPGGDGVEGALGAAGSRGGLTLERPPRPRLYRPGSWGPAGIEQLVAPHRWHLLYSDREGRRRGQGGRPA